MRTASVKQHHLSAQQSTASSKALHSQADDAHSASHSPPTRQFNSHSSNLRPSVRCCVCSYARPLQTWIVWTMSKSRRNSVIKSACATIGPTDCAPKRPIVRSKFMVDGDTVDIASLSISGGTIGDTGSRREAKRSRCEKLPVTCSGSWDRGRRLCRRNYSEMAASG